MGACHGTSGQPGGTSGGEEKGRCTWAHESIEGLDCGQDAGGGARLRMQSHLARTPPTPGTRSQKGYERANGGLRLWAGVLTSGWMPTSGRL